MTFILRSKQGNKQIKPKLFHDEFKHEPINNLNSKSSFKVSEEIKLYKWVLIVTKC